MNIPTKITGIVIFFSIIFFLSGCSGVKPTGAGSEDKNAAGFNGNTENREKTTLKYAQWAVPVTSVVEDAIQKYNEANTDNIQVEVLKIPRASYSDTLNILLSSGQGPDVFEARGEWLLSYIYKNWTYDLTNIADDAFLNDFPASVRNLLGGAKFRKHFYSIPSGQVTYRLIYNKDLFRMAGLDPEKPPETLDDLSYYAKRITEAGKGERKYGFAIAANDFWSGFVYPMEAVNAYSGAYYFNYNKGAYDLSVYEPWLNTIIKMKNDGTLFPGETTMKEDLVMIQFAEGNIGMMYAENWKPALFKGSYPVKCDWAVTLPPAIDKSSEKKGYIEIGTTGWQVVYKNAKHPEKAVLFWKYLYSNEYNKELYQSGCFLPFIGSITDNPGIKPDIPKFDEFLPGKWDAVYPATPLDNSEFARGDTYLSVFSNSLPMESGLAEESYQLNGDLDRNIISGFIDINDYKNQNIK